MKVMGVDEAGRGCIVGPMVICAASIDGKLEESLRDMGAKDSKLLSPKQRVELREKLMQVCDFRIAKITALKLNEEMKKMSLNEIEAVEIAELLKQFDLKDFTAFIDSPDSIPKKFDDRIRKYFKGGKLVCENKCDYNHPICSAASILAKVERDNEIAKIKKELDFDFGSGYTSDPVTIKYLRENLENKALFKYIRTEWKTLQNLRDEDKIKKSKQSSLGQF